MAGDRGSRIDRDEVLVRVDLEVLLDTLSGAADGRRRWHCPERAHPDVHPSVSVRIGPDGLQRWRCWSGGHGGTAIDAVIAAHGGDARSALAWLAEHHTNLLVIERPPPPPLAPPGCPAAEVGLFVERAARLLWTPAGAPQRAWLRGRGLGEAVLRANLVGADPGRRILPRPHGLPRGWPAVVYPSLDPAGRVVYLQARYLEPPPGRGKYDNPSAQLAANPRLTWTRPVGARRRQGLLVVCEGAADALVAAQAGLRAVGILGATYPDHRLADTLLAAQRADPALRDARVVICFDADDPGRRGAAQLTSLLNPRGVSPVVVEPPDGLDLTGWAAEAPRWTTSLPHAVDAPPTIVTRRAPPGPPLPQRAATSLGIEW